MGGALNLYGRHSPPLVLSVVQYAALASKVTMTSEVEHDIAGDAWPAGHAMPAEQATHSAAAADAAAAAAAAASAAQARIEELLDDKADLEYEIDVVERKVELLREEVGFERPIPNLCPVGSSVMF